MIKFTVICLGNKMPGWVDQAVSVFDKRLREFCQLELKEIPLQKRSNQQAMKALLDKEAEQTIKMLPSKSHVIALDVTGKSMSSDQMANRLEHLQQITQHCSLIIGGPEGISDQVMQHVNEKWSLSPLTLPHPIARIVLHEALYRSFTILANHPYHK